MQIGFLYLRYTCNPRYIWDWFKNYLRDDEVQNGMNCGFCAENRIGLEPFVPLPCLQQEFTPSPKGSGCPVSMGVFVRDILLDQV